MARCRARRLPARRAEGDESADHLAYSGGGYRPLHRPKPRARRPRAELLRPRRNDFKQVHRPDGRSIATRLPFVQDSACVFDYLLRMPNSRRISPLLAYEDIETGHDLLVRAFGRQAGRIDCDYERARTAGARIDTRPVDQHYGGREFGARYAVGHRWWFGTPVSSAKGWPRR